MNSKLPHILIIIRPRELRLQNKLELGQLKSGYADHVSLKHTVFRSGILGHLI